VFYTCNGHSRVVHTVAVLYGFLFVSWGCWYHGIHHSLPSFSLWENCAWWWSQFKGPLIQALYQDPESVSHAHYLRKEQARILSEIKQKQYLDGYLDMLHGADMIHVFQDGLSWPAPLT